VAGGASEGPSSAAGHQKANALALAETGAAVCLEEGPDFDAKLTAAVRNLMENPDKLAEMTAAFEKTGIPSGLKAAAVLADLIEKGE